MLCVVCVYCVLCVSSVYISLQLMCERVNLTRTFSLARVCLRPMNDDTSKDMSLYMSKDMGYPALVPQGIYAACLRHWCCLFKALVLLV